MFELFRCVRETRIKSYKTETENVLDIIPAENMTAPGFHEGLEINLDEI